MRAPTGKIDFSRTAGVNFGPPMAAPTDLVRTMQNADRQWRPLRMWFVQIWFVRMWSVQIWSAQGKITAQKDMDMAKHEFPTRKNYRLKQFDYSSEGAYFITICTKNRECILSEISGFPFTNCENLYTAESFKHILTDIGVIAEKGIQGIPHIYKNVTVDYYTIMPNHIHLLLSIRSDVCGNSVNTAPVGQIINHLKGFVTKAVGKSIWQKLFYDHVIRNQEDYAQTAKYISENPVKWFFDEMYT